MSERFEHEWNDSNYCALCGRRKIGPGGQDARTIHHDGECPARLRAEVDRLAAELSAGEAARRTCAVEAGIQDPSDSTCCLRDFVDTILALRAELAAERARPRPRVEFLPDVDGGARLSLIGRWGDWVSIDDASLKSRTDEAEAAGFDVSGCKEKP